MKTISINIPAQTATDLAMLCHDQSCRHESEFAREQFSNLRDALQLVTRGVHPAKHVKLTFETVPPITI